MASDSTPTTPAGSEVPPPRSSVFLPPALSATPNMAFSDVHLVASQLYFLSPAAAKVLVAIANQRRNEFVTSQEHLAKSVRMSRRSVSRALEELRRHRLIQTMEARARKGYVTGLRIRTLPVPRSLPREVAEAEREKLSRRRAALLETLDLLDSDLEMVAELGGPSQTA